MSSSPADHSWDAFVRELGVNLQRARHESGLSQERVAQRAGIAANTYRQYEKGESKPGSPANMSMRNALALSQALGVSLSSLLPVWAPDLTQGG
ncbi:helix-turn-helix domain-containing protein [Nocardioides carbamazepini]|uniref:helix-turn-helix domain-containing protein n=1 Tax=Nocardioides carbamazepini TaxID=2854259 RepID=UPI002149FA84|nr:helix-turn-helix transcriptional regulator [Nocardioides carbamazepini]